MPGPRPACQGLSVSRVITVCDPAFASVGSPHHGTASEQLRIICLHTVCVRPARRPSGHCHARPSARVSSTGLETQGPEASLLLLQRNLVYAPLRLRSPWALSARWLSGAPEGKNLLLEISFIPRGEGFFGFFCRLRRCTEHPILPRRACPCEYVARRPPHRRWVQETQPHTCGCAERILTAEFHKPASNRA